MSQRAACEHVKIARRSSELPLIHRALARGELSYAKVPALSRVATAEAEPELLELACCLTAASSTAPFAPTSAASRWRRQTSDTSAPTSHTTGSTRQGLLAPEDGALSLRGLEAGRDVLRERDETFTSANGQRVRRGSAGPHEPEPRPKGADALAAMADLALSASRGMPAASAAR